MRKIVFLVVILVSIVTLKTTAQDQTRGQESMPLLDMNNQKSMLIVPMMDRMFLSNMGTQLGKYNHLNYKELRSLLISKIHETALISADGLYDVSDASEINDTLVKYFHMASGFNYELVKVHSEKQETKVQEFWSELQDKTQTKNLNKNGAYLEKGEIKEFYDDQERFMNSSLDTAFISHQAFASLKQDYILIINELDIYKPEPNKLNYFSNERTIKLHFTLYSKEGERIYGNATFATFDKSELDIYNIINSSLFSAVNRMIAECSAHLNISPKN
jgi:hypothetical protein